MNDQVKSKEQLLTELADLRQRNGELEIRLARHEQGEAALRKSERLQRTILDNIPDPAWVKGLDGRFETVNRSWSAFTGLTPDEAVGRTDAELFSPETAAEFHEQERAMVADGVACCWEQTLPDAQGVLQMFETYKAPLFDNAGAAFGTVGIARNITNRKRSEELLRQSEQRSRLHFEQTPLAVIEWDSEGRVSKWNPAAERIFGYTAQEAAGREYSFLVPPRARGGVECVSAKLFSNQGGERSTNENLTKHGRTIFCEWYNTPLISAEGQVVGAASLCDVVTERTRAEAALRESESNFHAFFDTIDDLIVATSLDGRILFANRALKEKLGYSDEDLTSLHVLELHPAGTRREAEEIFAEMLRCERDTCPLPMVGRNGVVLPVETRVWSGRWNGADCIFGVSRDLSAEREAEQRFERLFRSHPDLMAITNLPDNRIFDVNDAFLAKLGYSRNEVVGRTGTDIGLFPNAELLSELRRRLAENGHIDHVELQVQCKNGAFLDGLFSGQLIINQGRQYALTVMIDITERKAAELAIRQANERLELAKRIAGQGVWETNLVTGELHWSPEMFDLFGMDPKTHKPSTIAWEAVLHPEDRVFARELLDQSLRDRTLFDTEFRVVHPDGQVRWIGTIGKAVYDDAGRALRMTGVCMDITQRRTMLENIQQWNSELERKVAVRTAELAAAHRQTTQAMSRLEQSEARFRAMFEQSPLGVALTDTLSGPLFEVNHRLLQITGRNRQELATIGWRRITHPDDLAGENAQVKQLEAGEISGFQTEKRLIRPDGSLVWVRFTLEAVSVDAGASRMYLALVEDNSDRKRAEQALVIAKEQAENANRAKGEFLANMSHEIRTPMNGVIGMTGLLLDSPLNAEQRRYADTILSSGEALLTLLNGILDFSRIEAGKLELEAVDFDLRSLLDECVVSVRLRAEKKGLRFSYTASPELPDWVCGDVGRLRQILLNLSDNALKFTERGQVSLHASLLSRGDADALIRLAVRDTGIGIRTEQQLKLFQKFSQVDGSTTRRYGGSGLGLAICKQLAELMGGDIGVTSQMGFGSEFWFTAKLGLPARSTDAVTAPPGPARSLASEIPALMRSGARILVAEDNVVNQEVALSILRKLGAHADGVADGGEAVEALKTLPYDLVFMDLHMPEMDGFEATRIIRDPQSEIRHHDIPIIALTASALRGDREQCLAVGMNDYVTKPVSPQDLAAALNAWLPAEAAVPCSDSWATEAATGSQESLLPVFDRDGLVMRLLHDESLAEIVVARFLESTPAQIESLRQSLVSGDAAMAKGQARSIKGAASNVGGERLRRVASQIEHAARAGELQIALGYLAELQSQFEQLKNAMRAT